MNEFLLNKKMRLFLLILFVIEMYYFFIDFFISGLFSYYGYSLSLGMAIIGILFTHGILLIALIILSYGVLNRKPWARKFAILFLIWASMWNIWGIAVGNNILGNFILLIIYILMIFYLTTPEVRQYFAKIFHYGKYILYTKIVTLKSGLKLPIYFFSIKTPKGGKTTTMPNGYIVKENKKSHMPYLKKKHKEKPYAKSEIKKIHPKVKTLYVVYSAHSKYPNQIWVVRSHKKIFSKHKTKENAIKKARMLARKRHARIMVQNAHGKFSYGLKSKQHRHT